jgi:hypothetical protein
MICIAENSGGKGGVAGGEGAQGQASQVASGAGACDYGYPVLEVVTGLTTDLSVQLTKDYNGTIPADLSSITKVDFCAWPSMVSHNKEIKVPCTYTADGVVNIHLTPNEVDYNNGVWYAEFHTYEGDVQVGNYKAYLCIRKGMTGSQDGPNTVTAMDVRLALMDTSAEANQLLDDLEFSDMMIYNAVERSIDEWNETPPGLARKFNATNFPFKEHLIKGAVGYLMQAVAYRYNRNRMQYSAAGLQLDTNDKGPAYIAMAQAARLEWKNFIAAKKTEMNMAECFGTFDLPYFGNKCYW